MPLSLPEFVSRWKSSTLPEHSAAHQHFLDLCDLLQQPHPAATDPSGESFTFEKHVGKVAGGKGFADVWKRGHFAWEYKGLGKDLKAAYLQLLDYREALENPPLLVVCDLYRFEVHTNFSNTAKRVYSFNLDELQVNAPTPTCPLPPLEVLRALFSEPELLHPQKTSERVTRDAAAAFQRLAESIELDGADPRRGLDRQKVAHFLIRLLFCLFADSIGLLPEHLLRKMLEEDRGRPKNFQRKLKALFAAMATSGNSFGPYDILHFNGGLFADDEVLDLNSADLAILRTAAQLDWSHVAPEIFGTLFERSLVAEKRSQIGAHYTSGADILLIVEPIVIAPLAAEWRAVEAEVRSLAAASAELKGRPYQDMRRKMGDLLVAWAERLAQVRVLDPACGSGNFLYLALRRLLDLWEQARVLAAELGLPTILPQPVSPSQLYGIEADHYAHELASIVVWIGYLQWRHQRGMGWPTEPILRRLDTIRHGDAILAYDADDRPYEPGWPETDYIIGNPPFLGGNRLRQELGDAYINDLFTLYEGRVPQFADLVCYWFEKARQQVAEKSNVRAGLIATQGIRGGVNRAVLERIKETGDIFIAHSDRDWVLDGANVHVSIIAFDDGSQTERWLDEQPVPVIHANLTSAADTTSATALRENECVCFMGPSAKGDFDIDATTARRMLQAPLNVNGRPNSDVVRRVASGVDLVQGDRGLWTIDFATMPMEQAAKYELPFEYVRTVVLPVRKNNNREAYRTRWWIYGEARPGLRKALEGKRRFIATPATSKHRIFVWVPAEVLCNQGTLVFARDDDYFFGVLHSRLHEVWARQMGTQLREVESGFRYTPTSTFETYPFPWPPGHESEDSPLVEAIAEASRNLVALRDAWLNPPDAAPEELARRTLTNLYNERPSWLAQAHQKLDEAVFAAYGWPSTLTNPEILERLLALNHQRAGKTASESQSAQ